MYTTLVATEIVNGLTWTLKTAADGKYQILEATDVATVRACNGSEAKVKYLDIH